MKVACVMLAMTSPVLAEVSLKVSLWPSNSVSYMVVDITRCTTDEAIILDPFLCAPGFDDLSVAVESGDGETVDILPIPKAVFPGQSYCASIVAPPHSEVGARFGLELVEPRSTTNTSCEDLYLSCRVAQGRLTKNQVSVGQVIRIPVGKFPIGNRFQLKRLIELDPNLLPYPISSVYPELTVVDGRFRIASVNHHDSNVALLDPFLINLEGAAFAGSLWVKPTGDNRYDLLEKFRLSDRPSARTIVPSGGIIATWLPVPDSLRAVEFEANLEFENPYFGLECCSSKVMEGTSRSRTCYHLPTK